MTQEMIYRLLNVNVDAMDIESMSDIGALVPDNTLPKEERLKYVLEKLNNPFCFRYGGMGIKLEFDENAPPLEDVLANLLIRQKSGLQSPS